MMITESSFESELESQVENIESRQISLGNNRFSEDF